MRSQSDDPRFEGPADESEPPDGVPASAAAGAASRASTGLSAGEVARRLGVAVTTIRTWDRRYGVGPTHREPGKHRRYDAADVRRLEYMRRLVADGVSPAEAARICRSNSGSVQQPAATSSRRPAARPESARARGLRTAAMAMDAAELDRILKRAVATNVVDCWDHLVSPVLREIGARHAESGRYVEVEHLLSRAVSTALSRIERPRATPTVLLACAPEEQHSLALEALSAALAVQGTSSRMLGARVPAAALAAAIARTGPRAVVLWAHSAGTADLGQLGAAVAARPRPPLIAVTGPGWESAQRPAGVQMPSELSEALDQIAQVVAVPDLEGARS